MESTNNSVMVVGITLAVTPAGCLEHARPAMRVQAFLEIDQTTRNGP